ncbi:MAG: bifunctional YncE family protein/alkaline phosphatase family protein [Bacteroidales bacterium]|nr:bifunctional YncE family protein/alkaline phosphatase family protein [Bacteroidales bacterium]
MNLKQARPQLLILVILATFTFNLSAQTLSEIESHRVLLPNGWQLTPVGKMLPLGDLPLNIAVSPSKKLAAVTNNGQSTQSIQLIDIEREVILDSIIIGKSWLGLTFSGDSKYLYASGGNDNIIIRYSVRNNRLAINDTIRIGKPWPELISVAGLALDDAKKRMYVVTKENNSLYIVDIQSKKVLSRHQLGGEGYTCILSPDKKVLYISCWGCDKVVLFNTASESITGSIPVGDNPNDMCITSNGKYLFVANANDNNISVINTRQNKVIETLNTALYPDAPMGSTSNSVALSKDEKTLYIANADNNCLAVFDISVPGSSISKGFIPTAWYPSCVRIAKNKILVSNGKGLISRANPYGPNPYRKGQEVVYQKGGQEQKIKVQYIGGLFKGTLGILNIPDNAQMAVYSKAVYNNTPYTKDKEKVSEGAEGNPIPRRVGDKSPIKYVFYIIKENRTYDQVLGDIPEGNGDPNLTLFGENITPNLHAIAREFVLLDNFYVNGEVSADGHNWSMGAYATDYLEKNWPTSYGNRGGFYPAEGQREIANNKNGFFWNNCLRNGVSYRTYGEFVENHKPSIPVLNNHFCTYYTGWIQSVRDTIRFYQWKRDFDSLMAINAVPQFNTVRFINDHTQGLSLGKSTPYAQVADNDLACGMFVDYLSHTSIWDKSLILITEDDAQNGPDHVDAHRSTAYIAGGYVKKGFVDHTAYTTTSLLRTMELILGLPPMSQYDAAATPLWRCMNNTPNHPPFEVKPCLVNLDEKNTAENIWQKKSEKFDFTKEDRVNDNEFTEVIWKAVKGLDSPCPPSVHAAFFTPGNNEKDED